MDFIRNTSSKYVQVQFPTQKNAQKRVQNVQEDETRPSTQECQMVVMKCRSTLPQCRLAQNKNWTQTRLV